MFLPRGYKKSFYTYSSNVLSINLTMTTESIHEKYKLVALEGPFIGKYFAILREDERELALISFGKGLFYGSITPEMEENPVIKINKNDSLNKDIALSNNFILSLNSKSESISIGSRIYDGCLAYNLVYDKGTYVIYLKDEAGIIMIRNIVNGKIKEEILVKEA